jgi:hypothetical protein
MKGFFRKIVKIEEIGSKALNIEPGLYVVLRENVKHPVSLSKTGDDQTLCQTFSFVGPIPLRKFLDDDSWTWLEPKEDQLIELTDEWTLMHSDAVGRKD